jgi:hypothetical protein
MLKAKYRQIVRTYTDYLRIHPGTAIVPGFGIPKNFPKTNLCSDLLLS